MSYQDETDEAIRAAGMLALVFITSIIGFVGIILVWCIHIWMG